MKNGEEVHDQAEKRLTLAEFLLVAPIGIERPVDVPKLKLAGEPGDYGFTATFATDTILTYCQNERCDGDRYFKCTDAHKSVGNAYKYEFWYFICQNCAKQVLRFGLGVRWDGKNIQLRKESEHPAIGAVLPHRLRDLVRPDAADWIRGLRCERLGLGIAAFGYYRRVVERQKDRIINEMIRVVTIDSPGDPVIEDLEKARSERQFTKAIDLIKHGLPSGLKIKGQNPLLLLHSVLSEGLHADEDEPCLQLARDVRVLMEHLSRRMAELLSESSELDKSVNLLLAKQRAAKSSGS